MKITYFLIPTIVAVSAVAGAVLATMHQSERQTDPTPIARVSPLASLVSPIAPPSEGVSPSPSPSAIASPDLPTSPAPQPAQPAPTPQPTPLSGRSRVTIDGIGSVRVGMTVEKAEAATGMSLLSMGESGSPGCSYVRPQGMNDLAFMVTEGRISRVDVMQDSPIKTLSGAGVGSTEAEIKAMYAGQIEVTPHEYVSGGHYLTFVPNDNADRNYRLVFETNENGVVTMFRSGKLSEVTWVEGCA